MQLEISDEAKRADGSREGSYTLAKQVKPDNRLSDISHAVQVYLEDHGCTTPLDYTGHGIGTEVHEDPAVPNYGQAGRVQDQQV